MTIEQNREPITPEANKLSGEYSSPVVYRDSKRSLTGPAVIIGAALLGSALLLGGGNENKPATAGATSNPTTPGEMATPTTSEAGASPSPESSQGTKEDSFSLEKGVPVEAQVGDIISGDIAMSDTMDSPILPLYDQDEHKAADVEDTTKTALFVVVEKPGIIHVPYGGYVVRGITPEKKAEILRTWTAEKERAGYKPTTVVWTGYDTTTDQAGYMANGDENSTFDPSEGTPNLDGLSNQDKLRIVLSLFSKRDSEGNLLIDPNSAEGKVLMDILVSCLCGCETPTGSPAPSEKPNTPEACPDKGYQDKVYNPKEGPLTVTTNGLLVRGDVTINGKVYHDKLGTTQAVDWIWTDIAKEYTITGPNTADILWTTCPSKDIWVEQVNIAKDQAQEDGRTMDKNVIQKGL